MEQIMNTKCNAKTGFFMICILVIFLTLLSPPPVHAGSESHGGKIVVDGNDTSLLDLLENDYKTFKPRSEPIFQKVLTALAVFQKKTGKIGRAHV
jgi:hypothetical protein